MNSSSFYRKYSQINIYPKTLEKLKILAEREGKTMVKLIDDLTMEKLEEQKENEEIERRAKAIKFHTTSKSARTLQFKPVLDVSQLYPRLPEKIDPSTDMIDRYEFDPSVNLRRTWNKMLYNCYYNESDEAIPPILFTGFRAYSFATLVGVAEKWHSFVDFYEDNIQILTDNKAEGNGKYNFTNTQLPKDFGPETCEWTDNTTKIKTYYSMPGFHKERLYEEYLFFAGMIDIDQLITNIAYLAEHHNISYTTIRLPGYLMLKHYAGDNISTLLHDDPGKDIKKINLITAYLDTMTSWTKYILRINEFKPRPQVGFKVALQYTPLRPNAATLVESRDKIFDPDKLIGETEIREVFYQYPYLKELITRTTK